MIQLSTFFSGLGITGGNTQATNFYEFWKGIVMNGDTEINNITEFMTYLGTTRYEFFKSLNSDYPEVYDEYTFYKNIDDERIYDYYTFYSYAGEYLSITPITPTPTPTHTPTPTPTPTNTPTPTPGVETYYLLTENGDTLTTENDERIEFDLTPTPTPTPSITPTITPTPTQTPPLSANPSFRQQTEFNLLQTGSTAPSSGEIVFDTVNACFSGDKLTVMNVSYTDRFGNDVESKVKSYIDASGFVIYLYITQYDYSGSASGPNMYSYVDSFVDNGTYATITIGALTGTCGGGAYSLNNLIQLSLNP